MLIYVVTTVTPTPERLCIRCSNVWETETEAIESLQVNHFDIWEGFTNTYAVIESMELGAPWTCDEVGWYAHQRVEVEGGPPRHMVYEIDKPDETRGVCNFGIG